MISFLRGVVAEKTDTSLVLDVNGVGYGVIVSTETHGSVALGKECHLIVYEHIKEDAHDLYGFTDQPSKMLFEKLLSVTGVGPKMAMSIINVGTASQLVRAISSGDVQYLQTASGVGKRLAERIVVELKDKLGVESDDSALAFMSDGLVSSDESVQALIALGFDRSVASQLLRDIDQDLPVEERVRQALTKVGN